MPVFSHTIIQAAILDIFVLEKGPDWRKESKSARRRHFLAELGEQLAKPLICRRLEMPTNLRQNIKDAIATVGAKLQLANELAATAADKQASGQSRCYVCARSRDRKVRKFCSSCGKAVCAEHSQSKLLCNNCQ